MSQRLCRFCFRPLVRKSYKNSIEREDRFEKRQFCSAFCAGEIKKKNPIDAFWQKVDKSGTSKECKIYAGEKCWLWTGARNWAGYGKLRAYGRCVTASQFSLELHLGRKLNSKTEFACHSCDNPPCVHPLHLFVDDAKGNAQDMARKRRSFQQRQPAQAKLHAFLRKIKEQA